MQFSRNNNDKNYQVAIVWNSSITMVCTFNFLISCRQTAFIYLSEILEILDMHKWCLFHHLRSDCHFLHLHLREKWRKFQKVFSKTNATKRTLLHVIQDEFFASFVSKSRTCNFGDIMINTFMYSTDKAQVPFSA